MRKKNRYERVPGSGECVSEVIKDTEEKAKYQLPALEVQKKSTKEVLKTHRQRENSAVTMFQSGGRRPPFAEADMEMEVEEGRTGLYNLSTTSLFPMGIFTACGKRDAPQPKALLSR